MRKMENRKENIINLYEEKVKRSANTENKNVTTNLLDKNLCDNIDNEDNLINNIKCLLDDYYNMKKKSQNNEEISVDDVLNNKKEDILNSNKYMLRQAHEMEVKRIQTLNKVNLEFLITAFVTLIVSLIGLIVYAVSGLYVIHPVIYIFGVFMGIGWLATALTSIKCSNEKNVK